MRVGDVATTFGSGLLGHRVIALNTTRNHCRDKIARDRGLCYLVLVPRSALIGELGVPASEILLMTNRGLIEGMSLCGKQIGMRRKRLAMAPKRVLDNPRNKRPAEAVQVNS